MQNFGGSTFASMFTPTLVAGSVKGTGMLAPVLSDSQETLQANKEAAPIRIRIFFIHQKYTLTQISQG
jgi:hypothetical protein|tara:strand:+ start:234 stop:437 length:204 start_codon:yes stop_codon:yes gene_type:complete